MLNRGPLPAAGKSEFVTNFEFVGTIDSSPYLCVPQAMEWREEVCGGEEELMSYCFGLAKKGGQLVAERLGTKVLDNEEGSLTACALVNIRLPISGTKVDGMSDYFVPEEDKMEASEWMLQVLMDEYKTFIPIIPIRDEWWIRLSAQIYLDIEDFEWTAKVLKEVCARVAKQEYIEKRGTDQVVAGSDLATDSADAVV